MSVRTRFAPSPTGRLHLGNLRIAVFNWLFTKKHAGSFVLRVEDTDLERNVEGAERLILEDLAWLGIHPDEDPRKGGPYGPYRQSERLSGYRERARELVDVGRAYPCFCTEDELRAEADHSGAVRYSGRCRRMPDTEREARLADGLEHVIRFALPADQAIEIHDEIRGSIQFDSNELSDFILLRADGRPTYNFAVVVDDDAMRITHVIRGAGHLSNTPRQALLFDALGADRPTFAHLPTVLAPDGGKLSKRSGAAGVDELREGGYHPDGVLNYLSLLGWSAPDEREVLTRDELVAAIDLSRVGASDTTFDPDKLRWLSGRHLASMPDEAFLEAFRSFVSAEDLGVPEEGLAAAAETLRSRLATLADVREHVHHFHPPDEGEWEALARDEDARRVLAAVRARASEVEWRRDELKALVKRVGTTVGARGPALYHPLRRALTGETSGPDLAGILTALGRAETLRRLDAALDAEIRGVAGGSPP